jgi:hypothetical protein
MPSSAGTGGFRTPFGDKLLPVLLGALGEKTGAVIDNLDRAESLGVSPSAEQWLEMPKLRNQMAHDYVEAPVLLADALQTAHEYVSVLIEVSDRLRGEITGRG